ncbi:hypothetical protein GGS26DRAFT_131713 [Hypomontagnella submonticulosa]|nr:hypothetical protein GGS26DRAFT_131713 [Hypomontagnella submonticulosa]
MASAADESDEYLLGDDSEDSFDEDERPNRWRGPKSTWQQLNSEEIVTAAALKEIHDRDLSIHLYNAFALKQRHKKAQDGIAPGGPVPEKDINAATGQPVQSDDWLPQRSWTAWPMRADKVPPVEDIAKILLNDPDERFTVRKAFREMPSTALEEIISGEILKAAKEKFNARPWVQPPDESDGEEDPEEMESGGSSEDEESDEETTASASGKSELKSKSRSRSKSIKREHTTDHERMDVDESQPESEAQVEQPKKRRLIPTVSIDDDLSYNLLRPSVRHILAKLDATLTVLHNTQESALNYLSESGDSETSESSRRSSRRSPSRQRSQTPTAGKKRLGRPPGAASRNRHRGQSTVTMEETQSQQNTEGKKPATKRAGRPKKVHDRLEGESDRDFATRIARLTKRPLPIFPNDLAPEQEPDSGAEDSDPAGDSGNSGDGEETAGPSRGRPVRRKKKLQKHVRSPSRASSTSTTGKPRTQRPNVRLGLRDWRDVLGAAALAGFPPAAVDRAARRCADLFGQSMTLHTLAEGPAASSSGRRPSLGGGKVTTYIPGMPQPPLLEEDPGEPAQWQIPIRAASTAASGASDNEGSASQPLARSRSRSRAASAARGPWVCSFRDCPRAADGEGFARRGNLVRHLKLVHGWTGTPSEGGGNGTTAGPARVLLEEVDSEDEMNGAVHVDGFLRPIRMRPGWRGTDVAEEPRRRKTGYGRGRLRGGGEGTEADEDDYGDVKMEDRGEDDD